MSTTGVSNVNSTISAIHELDDDTPKPFFSDLHAFINILQVLIGYGTLTLPYAFYHCENTFAYAVVLMLFNLFHMKYLLRDVRYVRERANLQGRLTLGGFAGQAVQLGPPACKQYAMAAHICVDLVMAVHFLLMSSCCLTMASRNVPLVAGAYHIQLHGDVERNAVYFLLAGALFVLPCCWLRSLKLVSVFSALGVFFVCAGVCWSLWYKWDVSWLYTPAEFARRPLYSSEWVFVGLLMYVSMPVGVLLPLENALAGKSSHLHDKPWLLSWSMICVMFFNTITGYLAYSFTGPTTVANYFEGFVPDHVASWCALLNCGLGIYFSFVLQFYLLFDLVRFREMHVAIEFGLRTLMMFLCIGLAFLLRSVSVERLVCGLGVLCSIPLGLLVPSISHFLLFYDEATTWSNLAFAVVILVEFAMFVVGLIGFVTF